MQSGELRRKQAQAEVSRGMAHHAARDSVNEEDHEGRFLEVAIAGLLNAHREEIAIDVPDEGHNQRSSRRRSDVLVED